MARCGSADSDHERYGLCYRADLGRYACASWRPIGGDLILAPHTTHASRDIDPNALARVSWHQVSGNVRPGGTFEKAEQLVWNEPCARSIDMAVALRVLAMGEEALRDHQMEIVLGARHCDIEEAPLLLDLFRSAGAEVRRNASINDIEHKDRLPFLALGGMNGRKDQIILVEQRQAGLIAGRVRRIERQFCQETLPRRISARNLFKLDQVGAPHQSVLMQPFEMRFVPPMGALEFSRPAAPSTAQVADRLDKCLPFLCRARRRRRIEQRPDWICRPDHMVEHSPRRRRSHAWDELHHAESRDAVA